MKRYLPGHTLPIYSKVAKDDSLFHYTTAAGLLGILSSNQLWSTAYYCANDETELVAARDCITPIIRSLTHKMIEEGDSRVRNLSKWSGDIRDYVDRFEARVISYTLNILCVYITCFCRPSTQEEFHHGLLSQWRGYGEDGGYAIQFSRTKLKNTVDHINSSLDKNYDLQDVHYTVENPYKAELIKHANAFENAYLDYLDEVISFRWDRPAFKSPVLGLVGGPLEALLNYLVNTKNEHFCEEKECRLSLLEMNNTDSGILPIEFFNRQGLIVPYVRTPANFSINNCIDWIIVGHSHRIEHRFTSVKQMVKNMGLNIEVRPSHIPYLRNF